MNQRELLNYFESEDYADYVKHYLISFWQKQASDGNWKELVTSEFRGRHSVEKNLSEEQAVDVCRRRSGGGTRDFVSTSLSDSFITKIVQFVATNIIPWHGMNDRGFTNYEVGVEGLMWTVQCTAGEGFLPTCYRDRVVVGINHAGLICHFHGDAQYARGDIFVPKGGGNWGRG
ncbi:MAG: hypothetical protein AAF604_05310 [Acidobacteriota bacterium]